MQRTTSDTRTGPPSGSRSKERRVTLEGTTSEAIYSRVISITQQPNSDANGLNSAHGEEASRRRALLDLLFFCSAGDVQRAKQIVKTWKIDVGDEKSCDYDKRYPLHLAASEGCFAVVDWLIKSGANVNVVDRFKHTPVEDAIRGDHSEVAQLLMQAGGKVMHNGQLVQLDESGYACYVQMYQGNFEAEVEWEMDPDTIKMEKVIGKGEFGTVWKAKWHDSTVAVKVLNSSSEVAKGELRSELSTLRKTHHPHTVQCLGAVTSREPFMIITEYMPMGSVADIFESNINLGMKRFAEIALHTARGMAYLHERTPSAIIHRDLKPANIMIGSSPYADKTRDRSVILGNLGVAKIADFGLCKSIPLGERLGRGTSAMEANGDFKPESANGPSYNMTGETGSYRYMAPEVFRHEPYNRKGVPRRPLPAFAQQYSMVSWLLLLRSPPHHP
mmetsp:Transcript_4252/g.11981  ORF Transcript_4252/g.11981 Transcript_4252/m.11981 type:complete len:445 (+) Transcript_4252:221-1555(+)